MLLNVQESVIHFIYFVQSDIFLCVVAVCILYDAVSSHCDEIGGLWHINDLFFLKGRKIYSPTVLNLMLFLDFSSWDVLWVVRVFWEICEGTNLI